jgi:DNA-binding NarL/FixJ family response regulator
MTDPVHVLSVEDNVLVSEAIGRKLAGDPRFFFLGAVSSLSELRDKAVGGPPMVVCMDLHIPGEDTLAMIRMLREEAPLARVVMLSGWLGLDSIQAVIDAGAWGYISKADDSREIVDALIQVAAGRFVLGSSVRAVYPGPNASASAAAEVVIPQRGFLNRLLRGRPKP